MNRIGKCSDGKLHVRCARRKIIMFRPYKSLVDFHLQFFASVVKTVTNLFQREMVYSHKGFNDEKALINNPGVVIK